MKALAKWSKANWLVWAVAAAYLVVAVNRPADAARGGLLGLSTAGGLVATLVTVFAIVGLFQVWVTDEFIIRHLGESSGLRGLAIGASIGTLIHGPLVGVFPLLRALLVES